MSNLKDINYIYKFDKGKYSIEYDKNHIYIINNSIKFPKTYKECCDVLGITNNDSVIGYRSNLIAYFQILLICRDAYWKVISSLPTKYNYWKYDTTNESWSYAITYEHSKLLLCKVRFQNYILVFPTSEIRDLFYKNFKDYIKECKTLL